MKDYFSNQSQAYALFRPRYPKALTDHIVSLAPGRERAWDCATGNGQIAGLIAPYFQEIIATDISENQLANAVQLPNITYKMEQAELASFPDHFFDLITVGQAVHWFDFQRFNEQVKRVLKPSGILALIGYSLFKSRPETDAIIEHFYKNIVGKYWDPARLHIDDAYRHIPFPFEEIQVPDFTMKYTWALEELTGYLGTWSAVRHYLNENGEDPVELILPDLERYWGSGPGIEVDFPLLVKVGRVGK